MSQTFIDQLNIFVLPIIDIGNRKGNTLYIDFILPDEFQNGVVRGVDCYQRNFICIKGNCMCENGEKIPFFQTYFQRYSDNSDLWIGPNRCMNCEQKEFIIQLLSKNEVFVSANDNICRDLGLTNKFDKITSIKLLH